MDCIPPGTAEGNALVAAAAAVSIQMAPYFTDDELELISAFFEVLGDDLALLAAQRAQTSARLQRHKAQDASCPRAKKCVEWDGNAKESEGSA